MIIPAELTQINNVVTFKFYRSIYSKILDEKYFQKKSCNFKYLNNNTIQYTREKFSECSTVEFQVIQTELKEYLSIVFLEYRDELTENDLKQCIEIPGFIRGYNLDSSEKNTIPRPNKIYYYVDDFGKIIYAYTGGKNAKKHYTIFKNNLQQKGNRVRGYLIENSDKEFFEMITKSKYYNKPNIKLKALKIGIIAIPHIIEE